MRFGSLFSGKALVMRARRKEFDIYSGNEIIEQRLECTVHNRDEWVKEDKFYHYMERE